MDEIGDDADDEVRCDAMTKRLITLIAVTLTVAACSGTENSTNSTMLSVPVKNAAPSKSSTTTLQPRSVSTPPPRGSATTTSTVRGVIAPTTLPPIAIPASGSNACGAQGPCKIGQTGPAGGIVFYVAPTPQKWGQFMEVRPEAFEQIAHDTCNLDSYNSYSAGKVGDGIIQTAAVIAACAKDGKPNNAGSYARVNAHRQNGFGNWFIPSKDELQALINSKVVTFATDRDLTSGTWVTKPSSPTARGFDVLYGLKKEVLAGTAPSSRGGTVRNVEAMSDGPQSYGNPNNRWGWIYIARAFGPTS